MMADYDDIIRKWETSTSSQEVYKFINIDLEKRRETDMTERDIMNKMKKGARVDTTYGKKGTIIAFDYIHMLVGIMFDGEPSYKIAWIDPNNIRTIKDDVTESKNLSFSDTCPMPKKVIYDSEAGVTVVMWNDGEKTIVRASEGETLDIYDAFCAAFCKRAYGTNSALKRELNKILVVKEKKEKK